MVVRAMAVTTLWLAFPMRPGGVPGSSRSVSGYVFMLNGAAVSWRCRVQSCVALSTAEAEFFSLCEATREAVYLRNLLLEFGLPQTMATVIFEDNQPCIHLVRNPVTASRSKHVAIRFNFVRERLQEGVTMWCTVPQKTWLPMPSPRSCRALNTSSFGTSSSGPRSDRCGGV
jgi:hypothetical protein